MKAYVAIDVETTGLDPKRERIIEIGAVKVMDDQIIEEFQSLINPQRVLSEHIIQLTNIQDHMLIDAPIFENIVEDLEHFLGDFPILGHNVLFDYKFLKYGMINQGKTFEKSGLDTWRLCQKTMPKEEKKNLNDACTYWGIRRKAAHRALEDARDSHYLFQKLKAYYGLESKFLEPQKLIYKVKKEQMASKRQKECLQYLLKYHKIELSMHIDSLTRSEVSRITDQTILQYGRVNER